MAFGAHAETVNANTASKITKNFLFILFLPFKVWFSHCNRAPQRGHNGFNNSWAYGIFWWFIPSIS